MECRVLSIQSHVVRGYVGNKSASFPLQVSASRMHPLSDAGATRHDPRLTRSVSSVALKNVNTALYQH